MPHLDPEGFCDTPRRTKIRPELTVPNPAWALHERWVTASNFHRKIALRPGTWGNWPERAARTGRWRCPHPHGARTKFSAACESSALGDEKLKGDRTSPTY